MSSSITPNEAEDAEREIVEYSPYPVCYCVENDNERPNHKNWIIPAGTTILVDFDAPVKNALQGQRQALIAEIEVKIPKKDKRNGMLAEIGWDRHDAAIRAVLKELKEHE